MGSKEQYHYRAINGKVEGDPHFTGPDGLKFDFNGVPGKSYCLFTDLNFQVNMLLDGYYDKRTEGAFALEEGLMSRCWNRRTGIVWRAGGEEHSLEIIPRVGPAAERGEGFIQSFKVDGVEIPRLEPGQAYTSDGGLCVIFKGVGKKGPKDMDEYEVAIRDWLALSVSAHVANEQLRTAQESWNHLNIGIEGAKVSPHMHGLMGQIFRPDHEERNIMFAKKVVELNSPVIADGTSGKGLLDGEAEDYLVENVLSTNCRYSVFGEKHGCWDECHCEDNHCCESRE